MLEAFCHMLLSLHLFVFNVGFVFFFFAAIAELLDNAIDEVTNDAQLAAILKRMQFNINATYGLLCCVFSLR
jgi:hypothetical protein